MLSYCHFDIFQVFVFSKLLFVLYEPEIDIILFLIIISLYKRNLQLLREIELQ